MKITVYNGMSSTHATECIIAGIYSNRNLSDAAKNIDIESGGYLSKIIKQGDIDGELNQSLLLHNVPYISAERVLLVGLGNKDSLGDRAFITANSLAMKTIEQCGATEAANCLTQEYVNGLDVSCNCYTATITAYSEVYRFTTHKSEPIANSKQLEKLILIVPDTADVSECSTVVQRATAVADGISLARNLGNLAPNVCTPSYLAKQARQLQKQNKKIAVTILDEQKMKSLGMDSLLSVSKGSAQQARLICMEYKGSAKSNRPVIFVGKGVTFDTGGISLKRSSTMYEMKYDMCGAATVFGVIKACSKMQLACNVVGIVPSVENMPGSDATRPGDVVTSMSGQTIEILNTEAEGRLILCDALTFAEKFNPEVVIDVATLTGACVVALGVHTAGVFGNDKELISDLIQSGRTAVDPCWELPMNEEHEAELESNFADLANVGSSSGGASIAACFLSKFTKNYRWAHLDTSGVSRKRGKELGATGRPVPMLMQYLISKEKYSSTR